MPTQATHIGRCSRALPAIPHCTRDGALRQPKGNTQCACVAPFLYGLRRDSWSPEDISQGLKTVHDSFDYLQQPEREPKQITTVRPLIDREAAVAWKVQDFLRQELGSEPEALAEVRRQVDALGAPR